MTPINLRTLQPMQVINRMLCMQALREIGKDNIHKLEERRYENFLMFYDDDTFDIDWEYVLFKAPEFLLSALIDNFQAKPIEEKARDTVKEVLEKKYPHMIIEEDKPAVKLILE
jgi:hypothetical protein